MATTTTLHSLEFTTVPNLLALLAKYPTAKVTKLIGEGDAWRVEFTLPCQLPAVPQPKNFTVHLAERLDCAEYPGGYHWQLTGALTSPTGTMAWESWIVDGAGNLMEIVGSYNNPWEAKAGHMEMANGPNTDNNTMVHHHRISPNPPALPDGYTTYAAIQVATYLEGGIYNGDVYAGWLLLTEYDGYYDLWLADQQGNPWPLPGCPDSPHYGGGPCPADLLPQMVEIANEIGLA